MRRLLAVGLGAALVVMTIPSAEARPSKDKLRESGVVAEVLDGDTFDLTTETGTVRVRVVGIQAPEFSWCGGQEARAALREVLPVGTEVRLTSRKEGSGNAPTGVWRVKRTVHKEVDGEWVDIAPGLLSSGVVFPFPFIGEDLHNEEYLALSVAASQKQVGVYDPTGCGSSGSAADEEHLSLEVVADGPGHGADGEFVMVYNGSDHDIDLRGWMVQDTSPLNAFFFPKGAVVRADDYVVVFSSSGDRGVAPDGTKDDRFFYAATGVRWNNDTTDIAFLFDDAGKDRTGNLRDWLIVGS